MRSTSSKWLLGCGIGCSVILAVIIFVVASGYFFVKDKIADFKEIETTLSELENEFGDVRDFTPDPNGMIAGERIEAFLRVRENSRFAREEISDQINRISRDIEEIHDRGESFWSVMDLVKKGLGLIPKIVEFYRDRSEVMLNEGTGLGEYYYLYTIAYYSYLKKPVDDGPKFPLMGNQEFGGFNWRNFDEDYQDYDDFAHDVLAWRQRRILRKIHRVVVPMMKRQLEELQQSDDADEVWQQALETELLLLEDDRKRIPWEDGLPETLENSLKPFKERLETSYDRMVNPLELGGNN